MEIRFDGRRALVTGGGKGTGRGLALKLADSGAEVIAVSRTQADLDSLRKENPKIKTILLDVGNWDESLNALKDVGPIDLLVNNAAVMPVKEFGTFSQEEVDDAMNINVKAIINITQLVVKGMKESGKGGSIVNISSVMGTSAAAMFNVYCATKGAVDQLTRSLAVELGPHKIRVNSVNPTAVRTRMAEDIGLFEPSNALANQMLERTPLRRFAEIINHILDYYVDPKSSRPGITVEGVSCYEVNDVVRPVLFLLSDHAAMITGALLPIDGGLGVNYA